MSYRDSVQLQKPVTESAVSFAASSAVAYVDLGAKKPTDNQIPPPQQSHSTENENIVRRHPQHADDEPALPAPSKEDIAHKLAQAEAREKQLSHQQALLKYDQKMGTQQSTVKAVAPVKSVVKQTGPDRNAAPIIVKDKEDSVKQKKNNPLNISSTQAVFLGFLTIFLLLIATVIFAVGYVANMMLKMQR